MKFLELPPSILLAVFSYLAVCEAYPENGKRVPQPTTSSQFNASQTTYPVIFNATSGTGAAYATACANAYKQYDAEQSSWDAVHNTVDTTTVLYGGTSFRQITYYENATTLCDGHPRVTYSPAKSLSQAWSTMTGPITATSTYTNTMGRIFPAQSVSCTINPDDCDGLWSGYSQSVAAAATITPAPAIETPFCMNQTAASSYKSVTEKIYGCGPCTIFGFGVELVYFPVASNVSRDMCASTPSATLTSYGPGAVITAYAGKSFGANASAPADGAQTAVVDGHTFTSGTAYISMSSVYAVDRCSKTYGSVVHDAILAMPSQSVLSLRYSQDHFQRVQTTDQITGYPVSYADFNKPIPYSAWAGQNICEYPGDDVMCGVIYENNFRPQLAIPPGITSLSPDFQGCQMWYNGLWDPPLALTKASSAAGPTLPGAPAPLLPTSSAAGPTIPAQPSQTATAPTSRPTAEAQNLPSSTQQANSAASVAPGYKSSAASVNQPAASSAPGGYSGDHQSSTTPSGSSGNNGGASKPGGDSETHASGSSSEQSSHPSGNHGQGTEQGSAGTKSTYVPSAEPWRKDFTIGGKKYTATGNNKQAVIGTVTCAVHGPAQTLSDGTVCSYGDAGLTFDIKTTIVFDTPAPATVTSTGAQATATGASETTGSGSQQDSNGSAGSSEDFGADPTKTGDTDTVTITISGEVETLVQEHDGGPVVIDGTVTLTPGGEPTTYPDGEFISVAKDGSGIIVGSTSTLGVEPTTTNVDGSVSGAIRSGIGYSGDDASSTSGSSASSTGADGALQTGTAAALASFEAFNIAAVVAIFLATVLV